MPSPRTSRTGRRHFPYNCTPVFYDGDSALVLVVPTKLLFPETFMEYLPLGRFAVDGMKQTVAVGVIMAVTPKLAMTAAA